MKTEKAAIYLPDRGWKKHPSLRGMWIDPKGKIFSRQFAVAIQRSREKTLAQREADSQLARDKAAARKA